MSPVPDDMMVINGEPMPDLDKIEAMAKQQQAIRNHIEKEAARKEVPCKDPERYDPPGGMGRDSSIKKSFDDLDRRMLEHEKRMADMSQIVAQACLQTAETMSKVTDALSRISDLEMGLTQFGQAMQQAEQSRQSKAPITFETPPDVM